MKKIIVLMGLLSLVASPAIAQTGGKGSAAGQTSHGNIPQAPVGHRQPRASDVPSEGNLSNPNNPVNKEDQALDRKIKSICRGC